MQSLIKHVMEEFRNKLPAADGPVICSTVKEQVQRAEKYTQKISALPAYKPHGRRKAKLIQPIVTELANVQMPL